MADLILAIHASFVGFIVLGLLAVLIGKFRHWEWVSNIVFRSTHMLGIAIVIAESLMDRVCPLTLWENVAREASGVETYSGSFIQHWLRMILYYDFEPWVFTVAYSVFGVLTLFAWWFVPPKRRCG